ncbi:hypothetical protein KC345_g10860, partial [Hortaea werneckii]
MLRRGLAFEGYDVKTASNGADGLRAVLNGDPDVVILDVMMPQVDGFEVCRRLREGGSSVPVLMLTAKDEIEHRVKGLDLGADDYLVKPFALEELLARVRALLRRKSEQGGGSEQAVSYEDITLDVDSREVTRAGKRLELTAKEFELLHLFMQNPKRVLSRDLIMDKIWGYDYSGESNVLEVYIAMLRQKTEEHGGKRLIQTIRGAGYILRGILAIMLLALSALIYGFVYINTYGDLKDRLKEQSNQVALKPSYTLDGTRKLNLVGFEAQNLYAQMYVYDVKSLIPSINMENLGIEFKIPGQEELKNQQGYLRTSYEGNPFLMYQIAIDIPSDTGNLPAVLQVAAYVGEQDRLMLRLKNILLVGSFATLIAAFTFGLFLARKAMSPIGKVIEAANGIQTGTDLSSRIEYDGPQDEIGRLIETVNSMLGRMEGFYTGLEEAYAT